MEMLTGRRGQLAPTARLREAVLLWVPVCGQKPCTSLSPPAPLYCCPLCPTMAPPAPLNPHPEPPDILPWAPLNSVSASQSWGPVLGPSQPSVPLNPDPQPLASPAPDSLQFLLRPFGSGLTWAATQNHPFWAPSFCCAPFSTSPLLQATPPHGKKEVATGK